MRLGIGVAQAPTLHRRMRLPMTAVMHSWQHSSDGIGLQFSTPESTLTHVFEGVVLVKQVTMVKRAWETGKRGGRS